MNYKIAVAGTGYVGLSLAVLLAQNNEVTAVDIIQEKVDKLTPSPGLMPDPTRLPKGCAFAPRCPYAKPECIETPQEERAFGETHFVRCSRYNEEGFAINRKEIEENG